jgi:hypothetical protein
MLTPEEEARKAELLRELEDIEDGARARLMRRRQQGYSFARGTDPKNLAMIQRFQRIFGRHIPCLLESEHHTIHLHQQIMDGIFNNPIPTISKSTFEADLKRFRRAIKVLAEWPIWGAMIGTGAQPPLEEDQDGIVLQAAQEIYRCLLTIEDMADYEKKLPQVLDQLEGWAREASEHLMDRRNVNWEAVNAVDRLRAYWESYNESSAPRRALNPASPFADYLRDAFEFFNISGDPAAAFKRWVIAEDADREIRIRKWK